MKKTINWNAVTALGQIISTVAVVMTLVYLTNQIQQAETASTDANRLARSSGVADFFLAAAHDPAFRRAQERAAGDTVHAHFIREVQRRLELTEDEATQLAAAAQYWFWLHWGQWRSSMDEGDRRELQNMIERFYVLPHIRVVWEAHRGWMDADFVEFVDEALLDAPAPLSGENARRSVDDLRARLDELGIGIPSDG